MQAKQVQLKTTGMNRDLSESSFNSQFAFENRNVRLTASDGNTLMSLSNERGTKSSIKLNGLPIGYAVIDSKLVLFTVNTIGIVPECFIYLITVKDEIASSEVMYNGPLGFSPLYPIETLPVYENQNAIKVYWTDGKNQPRVINIANYLKDPTCFTSRDSTQFDFVSSLNLKEVSSITSHPNASGGLFAPGTIQYVCTYYSKYGGESNIFYSSPLMYIAHNDRGASPEDSVSKVFDINLANLDDRFDLVRLYSIHRTSQDAVPTVKRVADIEIQDTIVSSTNRGTVSNTNNPSGLPLAKLEGANSDSILVIGGQSISIGRYMSNSVGATTPPQIDSDKGWKYCDPLDTSYDLPLKGGIGYKPNPDSSIEGTYYCGDENSTGYWRLIVENESLKTSSSVNLNSSSSTYYLMNTQGDHNIVQISEHTEGTRIATYSDSGTTGEIIDPTILLYIGGRAISAGTMTQKDNTLFLGNIESLEEPGNFESIKEIVQDTLKEDNISKVSYIPKTGPQLPFLSGSYPYTPQLDEPSTKITSFKYGEYYRFGVQLQRVTGEWSEPIWVGDKQNTDVTVNTGRLHPISNQTTLVQAKGQLPENVVKQLKREGYKRIRPLIVFPESYERQVICQGVLNPTVYNAVDRANNSPYAQASWFFRPYWPVESVPRQLPNRAASHSTNLALVLEKKVESGKSTYLNFYVGGSPTPSNYSREKMTAIGYRNVTVNNKTCYFTLFSCETDPYTISSKIGRAISDSNFGAIHVGDSVYSGGAPTWGGGYNYNVVCAFNSVSVPGAVSTDSMGRLVVDDRLSDDEVTLAASYIEKTIGVAGSCTVTIPVATLGTPTSGSGSESGTSLENSGEMLEFRHGYSLPRAGQRTAEIQCNMVEFTSPVDASILDKNSDVFFIDHSILTFHSPDLEFDEGLWNIQGDDFKINIVGYVPITGTVSDIDIQTSTPPMKYRNKKSLATAPGFYKEGVGETNISKAGFKGLVTTNAWLDELYPEEPEWDDGTTQGPYGFPIYPWHRNGSLNNQNYDKTDTDGYRCSRLKKKKMSNLRFSTQSIYFSENLEELPISGLGVFSSAEQTNLRVLDPFSKKVNYYGNIDKLITHLESYYKNGSNVSAGTTTEAVDTSVGYKLYRTNIKSSSNKHTLFSSSTYTPVETGFTIGEKLNLRDCISSDAIHMKYKSSPHGVISIKAPGATEVKILPSGGINNSSTTPMKPAWDDTTYTLSQNTEDKSIEYGWLWLADLVRASDSVINRFGGTTDEALQSNRWLVGGDSVLLEGPVDLYWTEGDTYYQRYDCLKTYPFTLEDTNSIVDILSFMCETRVNIDGRYDKNRGQVNNLTMMPSNFNLLNPAYTQRNNFFNYRMLDSDLFNFNKYPQTVTWTKTKSSGEKVDTWTNITMASTIDFDGDRGKITKLARLDDSIIVFQEKAVSQLLYNEQLQLGTAEGVPIEISNSGKVTGKKYISNSVGCYNKWSVVITPSGIYFADAFSKSIQFLSSDGLTNLTSSKGMESWANRNIDNTVWNPRNFGGLVSYYDASNRDVLFITNNDCLAFSEAIGYFTSFYSYGGIPYFVNLDNYGLWISNVAPITIPLDEYDRTQLLTLQVERGTLGTTLLNSKTAGIGYNKLISSGVIPASRSLLMNLQPMAQVDRVPSIDFLQNQHSVITGAVVEGLLADNNLQFTLSGCRLYFHQKGDYNYFFGEYAPFSTTVIVNPDPTLDKVFSTLDFRADTFNREGSIEHFKTFDTLETWNEYQHGKATLIDVNDKPSSLKKKFRVWRAQIPRNNYKSSYEGEAVETRLSRVSRDRMRNTWLYLKLARNNPNTDKTVLHDMVVNYFV